eukprot:16342-Heterococcus_DN1.PRE.5
MYRFSLIARYTVAVYCPSGTMPWLMARQSILQAQKQIRAASQENQILLFRPLGFLTAAPVPSCNTTTAAAAAANDSSASVEVRPLQTHVSKTAAKIMLLLLLSLPLLLLLTMLLLLQHVVAVVACA